MGQYLNLGLEYKNKKRSAYDDETNPNTEHMGIAIAEFKVRDYLKLIGSYAKELKNKDSDHSILSGGINFQTKNLQIGYLVSTPYKGSSDEMHHAMNVQLGFKM